MWVHLLVIALLVYILWLVTKRRDSMFRPGKKSLRNLRQRLKDAQKAKDLNDLIAMYQAKMTRAGSRGKKKLAQQYKKQIETIRKAGTLQKYKNSLKTKLKSAGRGARKAGGKMARGARKAGGKMARGARKMARGARGSKMQMPVGNYYFYFNTVPKAAQ